MAKIEMKYQFTFPMNPGIAVPLWTLFACFFVMPLMAQESSGPSLETELETAQAEAGLANYPNVLIDVSERFVSAGISVPLNSCDPITDCIVGASISGQGQTIGAMTTSLASNANHAAIQLNVNGNTYTSTVGTQRRVKFRSRGTIAFTAQRTLMFDKYGFTGSTTTSCARSDNRLQCVFEPRSKLVRHIASRQVQNKKPEADQEIAQHTAAQARQQLQDDSQKVIDEANAAYNHNFRQPLEAKGRFPQYLDFSTVNRELRVSLLKAAPGQLGADLPAPEFKLQHDIGFRMHESAFNNFAESLLAGHTLTDDELRTEVAKFLVLVRHQEYELSGEDQDWSVTFPDQRPISAEFRDDQYQIVISGEKWTAGDWEVDALDIKIRYRLEQTDSGVKLVRDGDIQIESPKPLPLAQRMSPKLAIAKRVMASKLNHLFPEQIEPQGLVVPGPWKKVGAMPVADMVVNDGWLEISWAMPSQATQAALPPGGMIPTPVGLPNN